MKTIADVRKLLKNFGTVIYTGDVEGDIDLMLEELKELNETGLIEREIFLQAYGILVSTQNKN
ncbi:YqgQ family protein [Paenactinomyces guangxiensis]|uniref:YqgQ family protein n=1 Tax=Paenactinomyces guangxiensis TaxID=1490290 RepID=A0A7W1WN09_9BACL|nr:YqgQ family protein [Paenactinomyces guangxiensis]MBA4492791.1 YqgQ family protein [Paenactinomyces guangxiensis]MBH8590360.1 YqgQ family protein [Paenactinomyces guangxiensis]